MHEAHSASGVSFDGIHSYIDLGLYLAKRPDLGSPSVKQQTVNVPGMDGRLDITEANGSVVRFENRRLTFTFSAIVPIDEHERFKERIQNSLHGVKFERIILDEDPEWYYTGRASVSFKPRDTWRLACTIVVDAFPYALRISETNIDLRSLLENTEPMLIDGPDPQNTTGVSTRFMLGTKLFPSGLPTGDIVIRKGPNSYAASGIKFIQILDNRGGSSSVLNVPISELDASGNEEIVVSAEHIASSGIALDRVYTILISGITNCSLHYRIYAASVVILNSRMPVNPVFETLVEHTSEWTGAIASGTAINANGVDYNASALTESGSHQLYGLTLKPGKNVLSFPAGLFLDNGVNALVLKIMFREGKL